MTDYCAYELEQGIESDGRILSPVRHRFIAIGPA